MERPADQMGDTHVQKLNDSWRLRIGLCVSLAALFPSASALAVPLQKRATPPTKTPSEGGAVGALSAGGPYSASGVTLRSQLDLSAFPGSQTRGADIWGYTSPSGRRYALITFTKGTAFVEVTNPDAPVIVDYVDGAGIDQVWRDVKTYQNYAYVVSDGAGVGLQVIDMSNIDSGSVTLVNTSTQNGLLTAHNVAVNEDSGFLYIVGGNIGGGGIVAADLTDPANPNIVGQWTDLVVHDVQVVTYTSGPFAGREIAFTFAGFDGLRIVDVTDKGNMFERSSLIYLNLGYCHQGCLGADQKYLFFDDELDEFFGNVPTTTTYVADVQDLDNPSLVTTFTTGLPATDHNLFIRGDFLYCANYASGLHIWDISDVNNAQHVGFFDTYPEHDDVDANFPGAWAPYVGFDAPLVLVSDRERGLFILDASGSLSGGLPIPTVGAWGLVCLMILVVLCATLVYRRVRPPIA